MQWTHPEVVGDLPPKCRAHTATLVDRKIVVFGGGEGVASASRISSLIAPLPGMRDVAPLVAARLVP